MSWSDPIADMLTRIRNGGMVMADVVEMPHSKLKCEVTRVLKREGYVTDYAVEGGVKKLDKKKIKSLSLVGVKGVGMAMSAPGRRKLAMDAARRFEARGIRAVFVDMKGAGHSYRSDFAVTGMSGLKMLVESRIVDAGPIE